MVVSYTLEVLYTILDAPQDSISWFGNFRTEDSSDSDSFENYPTDPPGNTLPTVGTSHTLDDVAYKMDGDMDIATSCKLLVIHSECYILTPLGPR